MRSVTLDTSCARNFLDAGEDADPALMQVIEAAMNGLVALTVTDEAYGEVARTPDARLREGRLVRLKTFRRLALPPHREAERDGLADRLHQAIFSDAKPGSRQDEHNKRDCLQLAAHHLVGNDLFLTRDLRLLRGKNEAAQFGIAVTDAQALLHEVAPKRTRFVGDLASITLRDADLESDTAAIRDVLKPLADDYPDFWGWLNRRLDDPSTRITVGEFEGDVAAAAVSVKKDERVLKLGAFFVDERARKAALGSHLLWSELRAWVSEGFEKVYVTVSSRHDDLIDFFAEFGFLVEGVSSRRYQDDTAEFVLAKHLVRARVDEVALAHFADHLAPQFFGLPQGVSTPPNAWAISPRTANPRFEWQGEGEDLVLAAYDTNDALARTWTLLDLERMLHPLRFVVPGRRALVVPINPQWADALVEYVGQQSEIASSNDPRRRLLLRADNAYYCYPKALGAARPGAILLLYVTAPVSAVIGEARIAEAVTGAPDDLFEEYGDLGVYQPQDIREHVAKRGEQEGHALALRFSSYVRYRDPVSFAAVKNIRPTGFNPNGLTTVDYEEFEAIRRTGGLEW